VGGVVFLFASDSFGVPNCRASATPLGFASGIAEARQFTPTDPSEPSAFLELRFACAAGNLKEI
jgi:hypothetical protein